MDAQDTKQAQGNPQEQDTEQGTTTRERLLERLRKLRELSALLSGSGRYVLVPTEALTQRAAVCFDTNADAVEKLLDASGIDADTRRVVVEDYAATLSGFYAVRLPLKKQADVVNTVKPWRVYLTERYGLPTLFSLYLYNVKVSGEYLKEFKNTDGTAEKVTKHRDGRVDIETVNLGVEEKRRQYLTHTLNVIRAGYAPFIASGFAWLTRNTIEVDGKELRIIEPSDFAGLEPEQVNEFLAYVDAHAAINNYLNYYFIAKYALNASEEELKEIVTPPYFETEEAAREYAERISTERITRVNARVEDVTKIVAAENEEQAQKAREELAQEDAKQETIRIPENIALLGSRDVYASVNGTQITEQGVIPISRVIAIYGDKHDLPNGVTPYVIEKTISGLNMLQRWNHEPPVNGWYNYETNITDFSKLCGYDNANGEEMKAILAALSILHNLYLVVWKPKGKVAINLLSIPEIGVSGELKGRFKLQVSAEALRGHQNFITIGQIRELQKEAKGQAQAHFNAQLIAKGQKEEEALLNEVFGYDTMLLEATGGTGNEQVNPDAVRNVKEYIRKHKDRDKKKVLRWFDDYTKNGILESYSRSKNKRGEYVYKWKRANIPTEQGVTTEAPEEQ